MAVRSASTTSWKSVAVYSTAVGFPISLTMVLMAGCLPQVGVLTGMVLFTGGTLTSSALIDHFGLIGTTLQTDYSVGFNAIRERCNGLLNCVWKRSD